jgi:hypothetical protein
MIMTNGRERQAAAAAVTLVPVAAAKQQPGIENSRAAESEQQTHGAAPEPDYCEPVRQCELRRFS